MVTQNISVRQIESAIKRLKPRERLRLLERLEKETWPDRFKSLLKRIDQKVARHPISQEEIDAACHEVRHKPHAHRRH